MGAFFAVGSSAVLQAILLTFEHRQGHPQRIGPQQVEDAVQLTEEQQRGAGRTTPAGEQFAALRVDPDEPAHRCNRQHNAHRVVGQKALQLAAQFAKAAGLDFGDAAAVGDVCNKAADVDFLTGRVGTVKIF